MHRIWTASFLAATAIGKTVDDARRLANLAIAAAVGRSPHSPGTGLDPIALRARMTALARTPLASLARSRSAWVALAKAVEPAGELEPSPDITDAWVEAFQAADPNRKTLGAYATPAPFAGVLAEHTLAPLCDCRTIPAVVDPAAGAGSLLLAAHRYMVLRGMDPVKSAYALHGVELDPVARELCVLLIWMAAGADKVDVERISANIVVDNAITRDWMREGAPFDAVMMNPPWESLRDNPANIESRGCRARTLARLVRVDILAPDLPPLFTAQGRGDRNLFKAFVELAPHLLRQGGRIGAIVPAAFGSDDGMRELRDRYLRQFELERWTGFENRSQHFAIDTRYKFGLLFGRRSSEGTKGLLVQSFASEPRDVTAPHVLLTRSDLHRIGGADCVLPEIRSIAERNLLVRLMETGTPFFDGRTFGKVRYRREVDLTMGRAAGIFSPVSAIGKFIVDDQGTLLAGKQRYVPVLEGRMVGQYDCFQKSWISGSGRKAVWSDNRKTGLENCQPQFVAAPQKSQACRIALCDVTSATNTRTILATALPAHWLCGNTAPTLSFETPEQSFAALAILNSMTFDWFARRVVAGLHVNKFYLARLTWPQLTDQTFETLATVGRVLAESAPRGGVVGIEPKLAGEGYVDAHASVELAVARGYGLSADDIRTVFDPSPMDRRGLWRHFQGDPRSVAIAAKTLIGITPESSGRRGVVAA